MATTKRFNSDTSYEDENSNSQIEGKTSQRWQLILDILLLNLQIFCAIVESIYKVFVPAPKTSVKGEIVLITGGGHGIGKELALEYASHGATVVCWDINKQNNDKTVQEITQSYRTKAYSYVCDVTNRDDVMETAKKIQKDVGDVTILVNNAGIMPTHSFLEHTVEEIQRIMNLNVMAHFWTLQAFLPAMIKNNHGHIVCLSSCAGLSGVANLVPYCTSKFAVRGMMEALYQELRSDLKSRIKFTTVCPYMVNTGLCKKPYVRFPKAMPIIEPQEAAKFIVNAQRSGVLESTIPSRMLKVGYYIRLYPVKVGNLIKDFLGAGLDSDL